MAILLICFCDTIAQLVYFPSTVMVYETRPNKSDFIIANKNKLYINLWEIDILCLIMS